MSSTPSRPPDASDRTSIMEEAGQKLKRAREKLHLKHREVEVLSTRIATRHGNDEFIVSSSRIVDIERGAMLSMFKLYSLCVIYKLDLNDVLSWYGISTANAPADAELIEHAHTHPVGFHGTANTEVQIPVGFDPGFDVTKTVFLTRLIRNWGKVPLALFDNLNPREYRYGLIGTDDWSMYPLIRPGSLVVIDDSKKRIQNSGWTNEHERPIYFIEHENGYACGWCMERDGHITVSYHPSSTLESQTFASEQIVVLGQVTRVAMILDAGPRPSHQP